MRLLSDNPINLYTTLLHEADELLDYWQEQLLTDNRPEWVEGKIKRTKMSIQDAYHELEQLTKK